MTIDQECARIRRELREAILDLGSYPHRKELLAALDRIIPEARGKPGSRFEAVRLMPEGWLVLSPWITTPEGNKFRLHISMPGAHYSQADARLWCEHIARELNGPWVR